MHPLAVAGQDPLEEVVRQSPHRLGLLRPRVPAVVLGGRKLLPVSVPIQVISREEKTVPEEQDAVALGVARRQDSKKVRSQLPRPSAIKDDFRTGLRRQLLSMNDAPTLEMFGIALGVGHVV